MVRQAHIDAALSRAYDFLEKNLPGSRIYPTFISPERQMCRLDLQVTEMFSTALIAGALPKGHRLRRLILDAYYHTAAGGTLFTFFTANIYPPDTDTNSLIFSLLLEEGYNVQSTAQHLLQQIEHFLTPEKIAQVWLSDSRLPQTDPIVSINAEILAVMLGKRNISERNRSFIINHLKSGRYWQGTRYYHSPDAFLYFLTRLSKYDQQFANQIFPSLQAAAYERRQTTCHPLDLAHRLIVFGWTGIDYGFELEKLLSLQQQDGSLPADAMFRFGAVRGYFGSQYLSTAFFIKALETIKNQRI